VRHRVEARTIGLAELDQPSVVGARVGGGQAGVGDVSLPADADGRIEKNAVDALGIHHGKPRVRIVAAGRAALGVGDLAPGEEALGVHLDAAERAELPTQGLERPAVDQQHLVALGIGVDPDGPVPIGRVDVPEPGVGGLQHMPVGVDDSSD